MAAQQKYITQPEFDNALSAFSGHVDHIINMAKADLRREIIASEDRLTLKIDALEIRLNSVEAKLEDMSARLDRVEGVGKANHQMMQLMLDQLSEINKKLGTN